MAGCEVVYHVAGLNGFCLPDPGELDRGERRGHPQRGARGGGGAGVRRVVLHLLGRDHRRGGGHGRHRVVAAPRALPLALRALQVRGRAGRASPPPARRGVELVSVNPASVQGPGRTRGTARILIDALNGRLRMVVDSRMSLVDVDDCARGPPAGRGPRRPRRALPALGGHPHGERGARPARPHRRARAAPAAPAAPGGDGAWPRASRAWRACAAGARRCAGRWCARSCTATPTTARGPPASWASSTRPIEESLRRDRGLVRGRGPRHAAPGPEAVQGDGARIGRSSGIAPGREAPGPDLDDAHAPAGAPRRAGARRKRRKAAARGSPSSRSRGRARARRRRPARTAARRAPSGGSACAGGPVTTQSTAPGSGARIGALEPQQHAAGPAASDSATAGSSTARRAVPVGEADPRPSDAHQHVARQLAVPRPLVVVAAHGDDRRHARRSSSSTAGSVMSPAWRIRSTPARTLAAPPAGSIGQVLADVRVGHHADAHRRRRGRSQNPIAWNPASTNIVSPVTLADSGDARKRAASPPRPG